MAGKRHPKRASKGQDKTAETFKRLADRIVAEMESNPTGWTKPWVEQWQAGGWPTNVLTRKPYTGGNALAFTVEAMARGYSGPAWATYRQWAELGGQVRKGEKGTSGIRVSTKVYEDPEKRAPDGSPLQRVRVFFVGFTVFHADQVEGGQEIAHQRLGRPERIEHERLTEAEALIAASGARVRVSDHAYYSPGGDYVGMPPLEAFTSPVRYYTTHLHELVHWTGAKRRLGRPGIVSFDGFGTEQYAREELVAELGAVFLGAGHLGLDVALREDHATYLAHWIQAIRNDPKAIWKAAGDAEKAARYLINRAEPQASDDEDELMEVGA